MGNPILQFGTSRFLQAHVDLFVSEALKHEPARALGRVTVVQSTSNETSRARIDALRASSVYPVRIRGRRFGEVIDRIIECDAIGEALNASSDWPAIRELARRDVKVVVSNTGDTGYTLFPEDTALNLTVDTPAPRSFPAKLLVLLHDRHQAGAGPITLLPCELVSRNGDTLRDVVIGLADEWKVERGFIDYLRRDCVWVNSLVDRIVSEPIHPVGAVAEPYALWAIERQPGMTLPCDHASIVLTDDLAHYERLKLFLLNLGHSMLAQRWLDDASANPKLTVLEAMNRAPFRDELEATWHEEVLPVFKALGQLQAASDYLIDVRERFENPFLHHRLADIAQHHTQKKERRFQPVIDTARTLGLDLRQARLTKALSQG